MPIKFGEDVRRYLKINTIRVLRRTLSILCVPLNLNY